MNIPQKTLSLFAGASLFAFSSLSAVTTDPVGYVTETIKPGTFNLIGSNLSGSVVASGIFESSDATTVTDTAAAFTSNLTAGKSYDATITNGTDIGIYTGVSASSATVLATDGDISSYIVDGVTSYEIRVVLTVSDIFGDTNTAELAGGTGGDSTSADVIWIPQSTGGWTKVYYNSVASTGFGATSVGWKGTTTGDTDASETPIYFTDPIFIQVTRGTFTDGEQGVDSSDLTTKSIVFSGAVKTQASEVFTEAGFNFVNRVFPGNISLSASGLASELDQGVGGDFSSADIIWIPKDTGGYNKYYYNGTASTGFGATSVGWKGTTTGDADASGVNLTSAFIIQRNSSSSMVTLPIPDGVTL